MVSHCPCPTRGIYNRTLHEHRRPSSLHSPAPLSFINKRGLSRNEGHVKSHRTDLKNIARRAMIERGLLPDFSSAAMAELARIESAATDRDSNLRDLTGLLWASIDNDDSRDLDQLTAAESRPDQSVKILVAIADVDALVMKESALDAHAKHNTTSVYTSGDIFPISPCCRKNCRLV
jgi:exoribonuclease R